MSLNEAKTSQVNKILYRIVLDCLGRNLHALQQMLIFMLLPLNTLQQIQLYIHQTLNPITYHSFLVLYSSN